MILTTTCRSRLIAAALLGCAVPATASPPPPPPEFISKAESVLLAVSPEADARFAPLFHADVRVTANGEVVARGRAAWLAWRAAAMRHDRGFIIGYSEGSSREVKDGGEMMVVETFDDLNPAFETPSRHFDARPKVRSTLYRFGADGLIHGVDIARVEGFWQSRR